MVLSKATEQAALERQPTADEQEQTKWKGGNIHDPVHNSSDTNTDRVRAMVFTREFRREERQMKIIVKNEARLYPYWVAVVRRTDDDEIDWCNHGGEINLVEIVSQRFDSDSANWIDDDTEYSQECSKCGALYNDLTETWED